MVRRVASRLSAAGPLPLRSPQGRNAVMASGSHASKARKGQGVGMAARENEEEYRRKLNALEEKYSTGWTGYNLEWRDLPEYQEEHTQILRQHYPECVDLKQVPL
jgi:hypothetical protein